MSGHYVQPKRGRLGSMNHVFSDLDPYDPRAVANAILMTHRKKGSKLTNLALQKLLYFCHARYLVSTGRPLVQGYFEAWTYGPVHPAVYASFKEKGSEPLTGLAESRNVRTGELTVVPVPTRPDVVAAIEDTVTALSKLSPGQLVALSHARDGPWDVVYKRTKTERTLGLRISNELILDRAKYHKASAESLYDVREPHEDSPLTNHGFS